MSRPRKSQKPRGFIVSKPFGDSAPYDVLVDSGRRIHRVQVKSVAVRFRTGYKIVAASGSRSKHPYTKRHIDFLAAYIIPEGLWYILPVQVFTPHVSV